MRLAGSRVLVTGGAGFIGSHLTDALAAAGVGSLMVLDDLSLGREENLADAAARFPALEFHRVDLADEAATAAALRGRSFDCAFHLAVIPLPASLVEPKRVVDANVGMTTTVCELARAGRIRRLVHFSSSEVYGSARTAPMTEAHPLEAETPYAASKVAADSTVLSYVRTFGVEAVILRPFNNFGPRQNDRAYAGIIPLVIRRAMAGEPVTIFGDGEQTRDFVYVTDTARAALCMAEAEGVRGEVFNVGSGRETSVNALVRLLLAELGAAGLPVAHGPERPGDVRRHLAGIGRAADRLGFAPRVELAAGLAETVAWYRRSA